MSKNYVYLDSYVLQQDMRIRLPKQIISNLELEKGKSILDIYLEPETKKIILRKSDKLVGSEINEK